MTNDKLESNIAKTFLEGDTGRRAMVKKFILVLSTLLLLLVPLTACSTDGDDNGNGTGAPPAPAAFSVSNLSIEPVECGANETVTISISVANTGGSQGSYNAVLNTNGVPEETRSVTIAAGNSQTVTFSVTREDAGSYTVTIGGLSGLFTVTAPEPQWVADGVIAPDEYTKSIGFGENFELFWTSDEEYIYVAMKARTSGWVSIGIHPESEAKINADMILGFVKDGETTVYDLFSANHPGPHRQDTEFGGSNNIVEFGGSEEGGYTVIEFKRQLDTGDQYDQPLTEGLNTVIWACGSGDNSTSRHTERGYGEIEL